MSSVQHFGFESAQELTEFESEGFKSYQEVEEFESVQEFELEYVEENSFNENPLLAIEYICDGITNDEETITLIGKDIDEIDDPERHETILEGRKCYVKLKTLKLHDPPVHTVKDLGSVKESEFVYEEDPSFIDTQLLAVEYISDWKMNGEAATELRGKDIKDIDDRILDERICKPCYVKLKTFKLLDDAPVDTVQKLEVKESEQLVMELKQSDVQKELDETVRKVPNVSVQEELEEYVQELEVDENYCGVQESHVRALFQDDDDKVESVHENKAGQENESVLEFESVLASESVLEFESLVASESEQLVVEELEQYVVQEPELSIQKEPELSIQKEPEVSVQEDLEEDEMELDDDVEEDIDTDEEDDDLFTSEGIDDAIEAMETVEQIIEEIIGTAVALSVDVLMEDILYASDDENSPDNEYFYDLTPAEYYGWDNVDNVEEARLDINMDSYSFGLDPSSYGLCYGIASDPTIHSSNAKEN